MKQWLHFEQERIEAVIGSLRYRTMTGKRSRRSTALVEGKRRAAANSLSILESELSTRNVVAGDHYTIADMAIFAYASRADEAGVALAPYPRFCAWVARVEGQPGFLATMHPHAIDPMSVNELP